MGKPTKKHWEIPENLIDQGKNMQDGNEFDAGMTGAYYGSSLEYNLVTTPQYVNAGERLCPMDDNLQKVFKPKRPYGTFGSLIEDQDQTQYRYEAGRCVIELTTTEEIEQVADSLEGYYQADIHSITKDLWYTTEDGRRMSYYDVTEEMASYKDHNNEIQKEINSLVEKYNCKPVMRNGRKVSPKYPDELLASIAELAKKKKTITGLNLKVQFVGKHTIATEGNYYKSSISNAELDTLAGKCNYRVKSTYKQGVIRLGTILIPIQHISQLKLIKEALQNSSKNYYEGWPESVKNSYVKLVSKEINRD